MRNNSSLFSGLWQFLSQSDVFLVFHLFGFFFDLHEDSFRLPVISVGSCQTCQCLFTLPIHAGDDQKYLMENLTFDQTCSPPINHKMGPGPIVMNGVMGPPSMVWNKRLNWIYNWWHGAHLLAMENEPWIEDVVVYWESGSLPFFILVYQIPISPYLVTGLFPGPTLYHLPGWKHKIQRPTMVGWPSPSSWFGEGVMPVLDGMVEFVVFVGETEGRWKMLLFFKIAFKVQVFS